MPNQSSDSLQLTGFAVFAKCPRCNGSPLANCQACKGEGVVMVNLTLDKFLAVLERIRSGELEQKDAPEAFAHGGASDISGPSGG